MNYVSPEPNSGCWLWDGPHNSHGYGLLCWNRSRQMAHKFSYEHFVGEIPGELCIDHKCRVTFCVNPEHLQAVTIRVNTLLGIGPSAVNARKTHCPKGHSLDHGNLYIPPGRYGRNCLICKRDNHREWQRAYRAATR